MENLRNLQDPLHLRHLLEHAATEALTRAHEFELPRNVPHAFERQAEAMEGAFIGIFPLLRKVFIVLATGTCLLCSSLSIYGLFYLARMPGHIATESLFFDYTGIANHPAPVCLDDNLDTSRTLSPTKEQTQGAPWAATDFFSKHTQWEAFYSDVVPKPITNSRILKKGNAYYMEVALDLPESHINRMSGMFGVLVELQSSSGKKLASSMRAARLPHESLWISTVRKCIWLVPLMIGAVQENRRVIVPSFRHFVESSDMPLQYATVILIMQEKNSQQLDPLEVTKGEIRIGKELSDFQLLIKEWFFTCYMVGTGIIFVLQLLGLLIVRSYWDYRTRRRMHEDPSLNLNLDGSEIPLDGGESQGGDEWEDLPQPTDSTQPATAGENAFADSSTSGATAQANEHGSTAPSTPSLRHEHAANLTELEDYSFNAHNAPIPGPRLNDAPL